MGQPLDERPHLHHLTGARCLCSVWILCGHFSPVVPPTAFGAARHRGNVAVDFFIVLSGFVTHWAYATRLVDGCAQELLRFYVRRIGRVLVTAWLAMAAGLVVLLVQLRGGLPPLAHLARCALWLEPWRNPVDWCPNGQTWTVAALLPAWLLYPLWARTLAVVERTGGSGALCALALAVWALGFGPQLALFCQQGHWLSNLQGTWLYVWPPSQLPDFALGAVSAALASRHHSRAKVARGLLADVCVAAVAVVSLAAPSSGVREGWEPLFSHGLAPLLAGFLYGSAAEGGAGAFARLLRHEALVGLGAYSFEVYLFQYPVHEIFVAVGDVTGAFQMRNAAGTHNTNPCGFMAFFLTIWLVAGLYTEFVEARLVSWLRSLV